MRSERAPGGGESHPRALKGRKRRPDPLGCSTVSPLQGEESRSRDPGLARSASPAPGYTILPLRGRHETPRLSPRAASP